MRLATANILSFGLDAGWGISPGVQSTVLVAPKRSRQQNPNVQFDRSAGYAFSRVPMARIDRAVGLEPTGKAATATQEIAGTRTDQRAQVRRFALRSNGSCSP
ncbi:MAG TPA: hypothetical protein VGL35_02350 [Rhizomicrobium sp.]|jgi:hypothetical protein